MSEKKITKGSMFELSPANFGVWAIIISVSLLLVVVSQLLTFRWPIARVGDIEQYHYFAQQIFGGAIPYRDLLLEYPPGVLPFALVPYLAGPDIVTYLIVFLLTSALAFSIFIRHLYQKWGVKPLVAICFIVLPMGIFFFCVMDIFAALGLYGAAVLLKQKKVRLAAFLFAAAVLIKAYPLICLPIFLLNIPKAKIKEFVTVFAGTVAVCTLPFIIISPSGVWHSITYQLARPPQAESSIAAIGSIAHIFGVPVKSYISHHSYAVSYSGAQVISVVATLLTLTALVWLIARLKQSKAKDSLVLGSMAAILLYVIGFKVGSAQYMVPVWLLAAIVAFSLSKKERLKLGLRLLAIGVVVYLTFVDYAGLTNLAVFPSLLLILRYVLLSELLWWVIRQLRNGQGLYYEHARLNLHEDHQG